jgi:hypothetical protein
MINNSILQIVTQLKPIRLIIHSLNIFQLQVVFQHYLVVYINQVLWILNTSHWFIFIFILYFLIAYKIFNFIFYIYLMFTLVYKLFDPLLLLNLFLFLHIFVNKEIAAKTKYYN